VTTYSTFFFAGEVPTSELELYVAPAGVSVLRDLEVWNSGTTSTHVLFFLRSIPGFSDTFMLQTPPLSTNESWQWQGRVVIPAGGHLTAQAGAGAFYVTASGYALSP
jgi:hypothetical protein